MKSQTNRYFYRALIVYTIFQMIILDVSAQEISDSVEPGKKIKKNIFSIQLGMHDGFIFAQSKEVAYSKGSHPYGVEMSLGWLKNDSSARNICNCYPRQGVAVAYFYLDNPVYGKSYSTSYFIEPSYGIGKKNFFYLRGHLGGAYLTNPFDSVLNPLNRAYSSKVNFFLALGIGLRFTIANQWGMNFGFNFQHISNAGTRLPNGGINWPTFNASISHQNKPTPYNKNYTNKDKSWKNKPVRWDVSLFGIASKVVNEKNQKKLYPIIGVGFQGSKQVSSLNAITLGAEIFSDKTTRVKLAKDSLYRGSIRAGLLAGNEFLLGRFIFSQRLGVYIINETFQPSLFHRWGLQYLVDKHWGFGFSFLAHGRTADFFDLKVSYSFRKKVNSH
jgi:hypothetical protein